MTPSEKDVEELVAIIEELETRLVEARKILSSLERTLELCPVCWSKDHKRQPDCKLKLWLYDKSEKEK